MRLSANLSVSRLPFLSVSGRAIKGMRKRANSGESGLPRRITEDNVYKNMFIPKGTLVFGNN